MTKVDFYILPSADPAARLDFACKLTDKAWRMGHRIYLHCSDAEPVSYTHLTLPTIYSV